MALKRELSNPLTEDEAKSLTKEEKEWLRNWNRHDEIPGEDAPSADEDDDEDEEDDGGEGYDDLTNDELKEELRKRDLPVSGNHAELVARLEEDDEEDDDS